MAPPWIRKCLPAQARIGLSRVSKQPSIQDALPRWEEGLCQIHRLIHQNWHISRKIQVIRQGVFPQLFSGCETFHVSLSTLKKFRAKLNVAVHGKKTRSSQYLSPSFSYVLDYEPFLYIFGARLSTLKSTIFSFQTSAQQAWNHARQIDLNAQYQKVLGPISAFLWCCQILSWNCHEDFVVTTHEGLHLHLLQSPSQLWEASCKDAWFRFIIFKCSFAQSWPDIWIPTGTWESIWSAGPLPALSLKFRTLGLLTASAIASIRQTEEFVCEFCNEPQGGQLHVATECPADL